MSSEGLLALISRELVKGLRTYITQCRSLPGPWKRANRSVNDSLNIVSHDLIAIPCCLSVYIFFSAPRKKKSVSHSHAVPLHCGRIVHSPRLLPSRLSGRTQFFRVGVCATLKKRAAHIYNRLFIILNRT